MWDFNNKMSPVSTISTSIQQLVMPTTNTIYTYKISYPLMSIPILQFTPIYPQYCPDSISTYIKATLPSSAITNLQTKTINMYSE